MSKFRGRYRIESARLKGYDYGRNGFYFVTLCTHNRKEHFGEIIESPAGNYLKPTLIGQIAIEYWKKIPQIFPFIKMDEFAFMPNHMHGILIISKVPVDTHKYASQNVQKEIDDKADVHARSNVDAGAHDNTDMSVETHEYASHDYNVEMYVETHEYASHDYDVEMYVETHEYASHDHNVEMYVETHINASLPPLKDVGNETHINASLREPDLSEFPAPYQNKFGPQSQNLSSVIRGYKGAVKAFATTNNIEFDWQKRFYDHIIRDEKEFEFIRDYIRSNPKNWKDERNNPEGLYF